MFSDQQHFKISFPPISDKDTQILILGSIPGDKSLELQEYYGHPRNRFWKVISNITCQEEPISYSAKKALLLKSKIGVWDVAHSAVRKGSLDSAIQNEAPNDILSFLSGHPDIKVIGFNGKKAEAMYDKYFKKMDGILYFSLPSTSPANASMRLERLCKIWKQLVSKGN